MRASDLLLVNHQGEVVEGNAPVNRAAFVIHSAIHQARPEVVSTPHSLRARQGVQFPRDPLDPLTQDSCIFYEDHT